MRKLKDYTEIELDVFRTYCNFTEEERQYFELRAKGKTNIQISLAMNTSTSTVSRIATRVISKISRVSFDK